MATHLLKKRAATPRGRSAEQEELYQRAIQVRKTAGKVKENYRRRREELALIRVQVATHPMHARVTKFLQEEQGEQGQEFLELLIKREQELQAYDKSFIDAFNNRGQSAKILHKLRMEYERTLKK